MSNNLPSVRVLLTFITCLLAMKPAVCDAQPSSRSNAGWTWRIRQEGNVCGLYAVARACDLLGQPVAVESLWRPEFIASGEGSTPEELRSAILRHGGYAVVASGLTAFELRALQLPLIANTRATAEEPPFNHWVCVQPSSHSVTVFDGADGGRTMSYSEFLATWNGVGLIVSDNKYVFLVVYAFRILGCSILVFVAFIAMRLADQMPSGTMFRAARAAGIFLTTISALLVVAPFLFGFDPIGRHHVSALSVTLLPSQLSRYQTVSLDEFATAVSDLDILVVDARMPEDYATGSVGKAVNIPPFADVSEIGVFLKEIEKQTRIVVFCQSESCDYSGIVAKTICRLGFQNVAVSLAGYKEYWERQQ